MGLYEIDENCIRQRRYCNIDTWVDAGYTGKGLNIMHDDVNATHSECCVDMMQTILPDAKFYETTIGYLIQNNEGLSCTVNCWTTQESMPFDRFIKKYGINMINNSTSVKSSNTIRPTARHMQEKIKEYNLFCTGSAGNNDGKENKFKGAAVLVTGVYLNENGTIRKGSPAKAETDFANFMGFQSGTSFSAPVVCAMGGLVRSRFGLNITQGQIYKYLKDHALNLDEAGKNAQYGWGVPIMGALDEIYGI